MGASAPGIGFEHIHFGRIDAVGFEHQRPHNIGRRERRGSDVLAGDVFEGRDSGIFGRENGVGLQRINRQYRFHRNRALRTRLQQCSETAGSDVGGAGGKLGHDIGGTAARLNNDLEPFLGEHALLERYGAALSPAGSQSMRNVTFSAANAGAPVPTEMISKAKKARTRRSFVITQISAFPPFRKARLAPWRRGVSPYRCADTSRADGRRP